MNDLEKSPEEQRDALIESLGLAYSAKFVPQSQSRNAGGEYPSLNWKITLTRGRQKLKVDYSQGVGHVPGYKPLRSSYDRHRMDTYAAEEGKIPQSVAGWGGVYGKKPIPAPKLEEVIHCLVLDASVLDYAGFEDWAPELGYDLDSRAAEKVYQACLKEALELRALIGEENVKALAEAFQDY